MSCRGGCCSSGGVASWTYAARSGAEEMSIGAGVSEHLGTIDIFEMSNRDTGLALPARGCAGTCGGALFLDVVVQGRTGIVAVAVELAEGQVANEVAAPVQFTDWRMVQPGSSLSACQTQRWRFPVVGPFVALQVSNMGTGIATLDLFAIFRNV